MVKTHGPRSCKPPRKLLAGQVDQSETTEDPKMLEPAVPSLEASERTALQFVEMMFNCNIPVGFLVSPLSFCHRVR